MSNLNERRAIFVYEGARMAAMAAEAPIIPAPWNDREEPFKKQFIEVIDRQCGEFRSKSPEELHGSLMQAYGFAESYKGMVDVITAGFPCQPFSVAGKRQGAVFIALCEIARQWINEGS